MALFTLDELITPVTRDEARDAIYNVLSALGVRTSAWETGAVTRTMIIGVSAMLSSLSKLQSLMARSGFLDLAEQDWLTFVARYVYGVERDEATFAAGDVTFVNAGGGVYNMGAGDVVVAHATTGKTYRNTSAFTLGALATLDVPVSAVESGSASNAAGGAITTLVTTSLVDVTVSNALPLIAYEEQSDALLRAECKEKLGSLSPMGPWDAYSYAARNALLSTGESAGITRTRITKDGYGNVTLYGASATGAISGTAGDLTTQIGAVDDAVQKLAAPLAVNASVLSASALAVTVQYELWAYNTSGMSDDEIKDAIELALIEFIANHPISGKLLDPEDATGYVFVDALRAVISNAIPEVFHVALSLPAADVPLTAVQVATLLHDTATNATVHQVPPPEGSAV